MKRQVLLLGDQGCGKTSILNKMTNTFPSSCGYQPTIGVDLQFLEHKGHKFRCFDLSGHERFKFMVSYYLANTDVIVLVGDANNLESIKHLDDWRILVSAVERKIPIITVINKCDLVHPNELKKLIEQFSADKLPLIQVSAERGDNILSLCDVIGATLHSENKERSFYDFFRFDSRKNKPCSIDPDEESTQSTYNCILM